MATLISGSTGVNKITDGTIAEADFASGVRTNTPSFSCYSGAHVALPYDTPTKMTYSVQEWDTDNSITQGTGTTDNRFIVPTGGAGKYQFNYGGHMTFSDGGSYHLLMQIKKNGTLMHENWSANNAEQRSYVAASTTIDLAEGDYVEIFASQSRNVSTLFVYGGQNLKFQGWKLT